VLFMVIEHFDKGAETVYRRARERGRQLPEGLDYIDSWVASDLGRCFQLMACDDPGLIAQWTATWDDLVRFEVVPVTTSAEAAALFSGSPINT